MSCVSISFVSLFHIRDTHNVALDCLANSLSPCCKVRVTLGVKFSLNAVSVAVAVDGSFPAKKFFQPTLTRSAIQVIGINSIDGICNVSIKCLAWNLSTLCSSILVGIHLIFVKM